MKPRLRADLAGLRVVSGVRARDISAILASCCRVPISRNSVLDGLRASKFGDIQSKTALKAACSDSIAFTILTGLKDMKSWVSSAYK